MSEIQVFVNEVMGNFRQPYPEDIIDDVFCAIEANTHWLSRYNLFVKEHGKHSVNPQIGRLVKDYTGLKTINYPNPPKSTLIKGYSKLGEYNTGNYPEAE